MADYAAYFCGEWMPFSQVRIDPMDRGFLVGDCVFDVARTFNGKSFRMREHVDRLYRSLKYVRIDPGLSPEEMERISEEVISRNEHLRADVGDYQLWQFVTRGRGRWAHKAGPPAVGVCTRQPGFARYAHLYRTGAHGVIVRTKSFSADALDPKVKNFSRMNFNLAEPSRMEVVLQDALEPSRHTLVDRTRCRCDAELSVDQFVAVRAWRNPRVVFVVELALESHRHRRSPA